MPSITLDCPRCFSRHTSFEILSDRPRPDLDGWEVAARCGGCYGFAIVMLRAAHDSEHQGRSPMSVGIPSEHFEVIQTLPEFPKPDVPDHLPEAIDLSFHDAELSRVAGANLGASMTYRRSIELAVIHLFREAPDVDAPFKLETKIKRAATEHLIPKAMADWAHHIREIGNDGAHDESWRPTPEEVENLSRFAGLFLTYIFTLPEEVRRASSARTARREG